MVWEQESSEVLFRVWSWCAPSSCIPFALLKLANASLFLIPFTFFFHFLFPLSFFPYLCTPRPHPTSFQPVGGRQCRGSPSTELQSTGISQAELPHHLVPWGLCLGIQILWLPPKAGPLITRSGGWNGLWLWVPGDCNNQAQFFTDSRPQGTAGIADWSESPVILRKGQTSSLAHLKGPLEVWWKQSFLSPSALPQLTNVFQKDAYALTWCPDCFGCCQEASLQCLTMVTSAVYPHKSHRTVISGERLLKHPPPPGNSKRQRIQEFSLSLKEAY